MVRQKRTVRITETNVVEFCEEVMAEMTEPAPSVLREERPPSYRCRYCRESIERLPTWHDCVIDL